MTSLERIHACWSGETQDHVPFIEDFNIPRGVELLGQRLVDAVFPDTPWESVQIMIDTWKECR